MNGNVQSVIYNVWENSNVKVIVMPGQHNTDHANQKHIHLHHIIWFLCTLSHSLCDIDQQRLVGASQQIDKVWNASRFPDLCTVWLCFGQLSQSSNHIH